MATSNITLTQKTSNPWGTSSFSQPPGTMQIMYVNRESFMSGTYTPSSGNLTSVVGVNGYTMPSGGGIEPDWGSHFKKTTVFGTAVWEFVAPHDGNFYFYAAQSSMMWSSTYSAALISPPNTFSDYTFQQAENNQDYTTSAINMQSGEAIYFSCATSFWGYDNSSTGGSGDVVVWYTTPSSGGSGGSSAILTLNSERSIYSIREFLNGKDGIAIGSSDISLIGLFSTAQANDIELPNGNFVAPHALSEFHEANYTSGTSISSITSSNIKTVCETLIADPGVLAAGPLFGDGSARTNTPGAYEIVLAPGYRIKGDPGSYWHRSRRYVIDVDTDGFVYNRHFRYQFRNNRASFGNFTLHGLSSASSIDAYTEYVNDYSDLLNGWNQQSSTEVRTKSTWGEDHWRIFGRSEGRSLNVETSIELETDTTGFTTGTVLEFNHPVRWGNVGANVWQRNFYYTAPRGITNYTIIGAGGGGGANNNNGDGGAGSGGDSGGIRSNISVSKPAGTVLRIRVGLGGVGGSMWFNGPLAIHPNALATDNVNNALFNNFYSFGYGQRGLNSALKFGSEAEIVSNGGGGGISAFGGNTVGTPVITSGATGPGTPGGQAGSVPAWDSDATQAGGSTGFGYNIGDGGFGVWAQNAYGFGHQAGTFGYTSQGNTSGADGAVWITLA